MEKKKWVEQIKADCEKIGAYKPSFDSTIETLAQILEQRDQVHQQYVNGGCNPTIIVTTDRSAKENIHKNPLINMELDLNRVALNYWESLGLTPSGLKKLKIQEEESGSLADVLKSLK